jgi:hypothetical protein
VPPEDAQETIRRAGECGDQGFRIGVVEAGARVVRYA